MTQKLYSNYKKETLSNSAVYLCNYFFLPLVYTRLVVLLISYGIYCYRYYAYCEVRFYVGLILCFLFLLPNYLFGILGFW